MYVTQCNSVMRAGKGGGYDDHSHTFELGSIQYIPAQWRSTRVQLQLIILNTPTGTGSEGYTMRQSFVTVAVHHVPEEPASTSNGAHSTALGE